MPVCSMIEVVLAAGQESAKSLQDFSSKLCVSLSVKRSNISYSKSFPKDEITQFMQTLYHSIFNITNAKPVLIFRMHKRE